MDDMSKQRVIYLAKILYERTDDEHYLTTAQLCSILKDEYGIDTHRTTVKNDIEVLKQTGFDVQEVRSTQNQYSFNDRTFDIPELKLLIDAVKSAKFMTKSKSDQLVAKLITLAGVNKAGELERNLTVDGRSKTKNEQVLIIIDAINQAINQKCKIEFQMDEYNAKKRRVLHNSGEVYTFSPYSLVWDGDFYYVVGFSDKHGAVGSHRVDRIHKCPKILEEKAIPAPNGFDISKYVNTTFRMYNAPRRKVELICDNSLMNAIIDRFGPDVNTSEYDKDHFLVTAEIAVGTVFFNWVFGFRGKVGIKSPGDVGQQFKDLLTMVFTAQG